MPRGSRHTLTGMLKQSKMGIVLEVDDGGTWRLDVGGAVRNLIGQRVTVEGARSDFDLIDVDHIERARAP